ncbi:hypothetical protein RND81_01G017900 [Saponaria officinalis]|uniref:protein-serine/threonine phosphatase n=1 Tax=Saponaria officinalis TaxID=3572 RepID=A0AAW1NC89_SAPOF
MDDQGVDNEIETTNFRIDMISSLFDQQIFNNHQKNPTKDDTNCSCSHPIFISNVCTNCGFRNDYDGNEIISTIPFSYIYPNLSLSLKEIDRIRDLNLRRLISRKKIHLILDLDHTLLHQRPSYKLTPEDKQFLRHQKHGINHNLVEGGSLFKNSNGWVKLRPYLRNFLEEASTMFDMTMYTLGCRTCSWEIAKTVDPTGAYFENWRLITRDDYDGKFDKHKKTLDLVLEHEKVVVILDDNEGVWEDYKGNYVKVIPYNFFSYFSPEDKEHDASPRKHSWSQLGGDESEENGVLVRVLEKLRLIHTWFYDEDGEFGGDFCDRDVRDVIQRVELFQNGGKKGQRYKKKKIGKIVRG